MSEPIKKAEVQKLDDEIIRNFELLQNLDVLEDTDLWDDLLGLVLADGTDAGDLMESEK